MAVCLVLSHSLSGLWWWVLSNGMRLCNPQMQYVGGLPAYAQGLTVQHPTPPIYRMPTAAPMPTGVLVAFLNVLSEKLSRCC